MHFFIGIKKGYFLGEHHHIFYSKVVFVNHINSLVNKGCVYPERLKVLSYCVLTFSNFNDKIKQIQINCKGEKYLKKDSAFANDRLRISITNTCNFHCTYCTNEGQQHGQNDFLNIDFIERLVDKIIEEDIPVKKINITGGEPFLHPHLLDIVKEFKKICNYITINTNASLLDRDFLLELKNNGLTNLKIGIDSIFKSNSKPEVTTSLKQYANQELLENIVYSVKIMPRTSLNIVLSSYNDDEILNIYNFIKCNSIDLVDFLQLIEYDFRNNKILQKAGLSFNELLKLLDGEIKEVSYDNKLCKYICELSNGLKIQFAEDFCRMKACRNLWTRIGALGELIPCIKKRDYYIIDLDKNLREQLLFSNCKMCENLDASYKDIPLCNYEEFERIYY